MLCRKFFKEIALIGLLFSSKGKFKFPSCYHFCFIVFEDSFNQCPELHLFKK